MENNIISMQNITKQPSTLLRIANGLAAPVRWLRGYYSEALGRRLSMRQTLHLINAQTAVFVTLAIGDAPLAAHAVCLAWTACAVAGYRKAR